MSEGRSKYHNILNDYGFCTIEIVDGKMIDTKIPDKPNIRFRLTNTTNEQYNKICEEMEKNHTVQSVCKDKSNMTNYTCGSANKFAYDSNNGKRMDICHIDHIKNFLKVIGKDSHIDAIIDLHKKTYEQVIDSNKNDFCDINKTFKNQCWKLVDLSFSNVFSYGNKNFINFDGYETNKVIGIFGQNYYGKSAIIDIILYCLFDKCSRGSKDDILNKNKKKFTCTLRLKIGSEIYSIERTGGRSFAGSHVKSNKNKIVKVGGVKTKVKFFVSDENTPNKVKILDEDDKIKTNKKIVELVGTYDDYVATCICLQTADKNFIDMKQVEKKEFLQKILRVDIFEYCNQIIKSENKKLSGSIETLEKEKNDITIDDINDKIKDITEEMSILKHKIQRNNDLKRSIRFVEKPVFVKYHELDEYQLDMRGNVRDIISVIQKELNDCDVEDSEIINDQIVTLKDKCNKIENKLASLRSEKDELQKQIFYVADDHSNYTCKFDEKNDIDKQIHKNLKKMEKYDHLSDINVSSEINKLKKHNLELVNDQQLIDNKNKTIKHNKEFISYLSKITTKIELCLDDDLSKKHYNILTDVIDDNKQWIHERGNIGKCKDAQSKHNQINLNNETIEILENVLKLRNENKSLNDKLETVNEFISRYNKIEQRISKNKIITDKLNVIEQQINDKNISLQQIKKQIDIYSSKVIKLNSMTDHKKMLVRKLELLNSYNLSCLNYWAKLKNFNAMEKSGKDLDGFNVNMSNKCQKLESELEFLQKNVDKYNKYAKELKKKLKEQELYNLYIQVTDFRKGLPCYMIRECIEPLNNNVNDILSSFVNFEIQFTINHFDGDDTLKKPKKINQRKIGDINVSICHPNQNPYDIGLGSGSEKFLVSLAIRIALAQMIMTSKPNFIVIDEGWSCFDRTNLDNVGAIINIIKNFYDHVIIISHLEQLQQQCDQIIMVDKNKEQFSYVTNTQVNRKKRKILVDKNNSKLVHNKHSKVDP